MKTPNACFLLLLLFGLAACTQPNPPLLMASSHTDTHRNNPYYSRSDTNHLDVSNAEWKRILPADVYHVAREQGTERPFTGEFWDADAQGMYYCKVCGNALFKAEAKFASSCGWPSFYEAIRPGSVQYRNDSSHGMQRTEVLCGRCDSHLGHIFPDGPPPTGMRFCMNSAVLDFEAGK